MLLLRLFKITDTRYLNAMSQAGTIGLHMVSGIVVGGLLGYGVDLWFLSSPKGLLVGLLLGIVAAFKNVYVDTKRLLERQKEEDAEYAASLMKGMKGAQDAGEPRSGASGKKD